MVMATSVTQSLFGMTPQAIQAQRAAQLDERALAFGQMNPMQAARAATFRAGSLFGDAAAGAMGFEDPEIAQAKQVQGLLSNANMNDPEGLMSLSQRLQSINPAVAQELAQRAMNMRKTQVETQRIEANMQGDQAKLLQDQQSYQMRYEAVKSRFPNLPEAEVRAVANNEATFREVFKDQQAKLSSFAQQLVDEGLQPGSPAFQRRMQEYNQRQVSKKSLEETLGAGLTGIASAMAGKQAEAAASKGGQVVGDAAARIQSGFNSRDALVQARQMLDKGIYAGAYGPLGEQVARFTGGVLGSTDRVANTQEFRSYIGKTVMPMMAMLGGSDSNEELKKMEAIMAANTTLEPKAMKNILDSALAAVERDIKRIQMQQQAVQGGQPLPTGPIEGSPTPKATRRFNRETGKFETIGGR
jgi:hypothetical protein